MNTQRSDFDDLTPIKLGITALEPEICFTRCSGFT